jgi:Spy/CpxP family protein refolding chaperone
MSRIHHPFFFWFNVVFLVVNIAIVVTVMAYQPKPENPCSSGNCPNSKKAMAKELALSKTQQDSFYSIKAKYHTQSEPVVKELRLEKDLLLQTLEENPSDTTKIKKLVQKISASQAKLMEHTTHQYIDIHNILTPVQREKHRHIYRDIFGCKSEKKHHSKYHSDSSFKKETN